MTGTALKIVAIISMLIDHIGAVLIDRSQYPELYEMMRLIGRISFPIFCFLLVEGYIHTSNKRHYIIRLAIFAIISEIPFDLAMYGICGIYWNHQNVFFTLLLGLIMLCCIDKFTDNSYMQLGVVAIAALLAFLFNTDYRYSGIIQIAFFYFMRNMQLYRIFSIVLINLYMKQPFGATALVLTETYRGRRGANIKYLFYVFYPVHLIILYIIKECIIY